MSVIAGALDHRMAFVARSIGWESVPSAFVTALASWNWSSNSADRVWNPTLDLR
jgi:hypothetical protein